MPDGTPPVAVANPIADYLPNARPGARAPHLWLERDGARLSSLDLFDTAFVLLTGRDGDPWREAAAAIARQDRVPLQAYRVGDRRGGGSGRSRRRLSRPLRHRP